MTQTMAPPTNHDVTTSLRSDQYHYATCDTCGWHSGPCVGEQKATVAAGGHLAEIAGRVKRHHNRQVGWAVTASAYTSVVILILAAGGDGAGASVGALVFTTIGGLLYFLPTLQAKSRGHQNIGAIAVINIFLGWTMIGWVVALAMACSAVRPEPAYRY